VIVLTRAFIETVLRKCLGYKPNKKISIRKIINDANRNNIISKEIKEKAHKIRAEANKILHQGNVKDENELTKAAKFAVEFGLDFLKEIYFVNKIKILYNDSNSSDN
jgi:hypothetical protein